MSDFKLDANAKYAKTHEWVRIEDGIAVVGISAAAQDMLSDVVFVELPEVGSQISAGDQVAVVESVKAAEDVNAPISGEVVEVNSDLEDEPEEVNTDPYGAWFFKVKPGDDLDAELAALMTSEEYDAFVDEDAH
jgi:glycine cleavage system H protein